MSRPAFSLFLVAVCLLPAVAHAEEAPSGWTIAGLPDDDLYPRYIADPKRTVFGVRPMVVPESEIPETGTFRFGLNLGSRLGLFRLHPRDDPDRGLQADLEVGFMGQSDWENSTGNIGWDGTYALIFSYRSHSRLQWRFGAHHISSHLGDEYLEKTGRVRLDYMREDFLLGAAIEVNERSQFYVEGGYAYTWHSYLQERGRAQVGFQHETPPSIWKERLGWYTAIDVSAYAERDWALNSAVQGGFVWPHDERKWRIGIELYEGRSPMGEFFLEDESYVSGGVWLDL